MELDPHLAYSIRSRGENGEGVRVAFSLLTELFSLSLSLWFLAGGELAVAGF